MFSAMCAYCNTEMYLFYIVASSMYLLCKTVNQLLFARSSHVCDNATFF